jgi:6-pyruvoyl-tetrahydropterin synthase
VNTETKQQLQHTYSPNKSKKFKQTLSTRKMMKTIFWDRKGVLMVEFMLQWTTTSEVYCKMEKKNAWGHSEQMASHADIWCSVSA